MSDRYGRDVLTGDWKRPPRGRTSELTVELGMIIEEASTGFVGEVMRVERDLGTVELEDRRLKRKVFPLGPGFLDENGKPVHLVAPIQAGPAKPNRTASGSLVAADTRAKVALPSRIWVEGRHDAELVEKVWGDDLRAEGVAVEYLGGIDDLRARVEEFSPSADRRLGVLVDHLVPNSKETRIAASVTGRHVLVVGHPYVDVWQSVKPARLGVNAWPQVPRSMEWKHGICEAFGWPHSDQADIARAWKQILGTVNSWTDLEPEFLGRVEELIDFVTG
jgi:hypothetical protein